MWIKCDTNLVNSEIVKVIDRSGSTIRLLDSVVIDGWVKTTFLSHLNTDAHGYPIPYVVFQKPTEGEALSPSYSTYDWARFSDCIKYRKCGICGKEIHGPVYFIAGAEQEQFLAFDDPAMHKECCEYAASTCPFMALSDHPSRLGTLYIYMANSYKVRERNDKIVLEVPAIILKKEIKTHNAEE